MKTRDSRCNVPKNNHYQYPRSVLLFSVFSRMFFILNRSQCQLLRSVASSTVLYCKMFSGRSMQRFSAISILICSFFIFFHSIRNVIKDERDHTTTFLTYKQPGPQADFQIWGPQRSSINHAKIIKEGFKVLILERHGTSFDVIKSSVMVIFSKLYPRPPQPSHTLMLRVAI